MKRSVYVFDAYGTLFDVHAAIARHREACGPDADRLSELWRTKQLEYSWTLTLAGRYEDFWTLTSRALDYALARFPRVPASIRQRRDFTRLLPVAALAVFVGLAVAVRGVGGFPDSWNINRADPVDDLHRWVRDNQRTHPVFEFFFQPVSDVVDWALETLAEQLQALPWFALPLVVVAITRAAATAVNQ